MSNWLFGYPAARQSPRLWVEQVWLVDSLVPLVITRSIEFRQGLNVVWAKEPDTDDDSGLASAGHGVGKTSLCYLIRHCLGDEAPSIATLCDKAVGAFPKGGVAAKVHLEDVAWVVYRPYARGGGSKAAIGDSLDSLLAGHLEGTFEGYQDALHAAFLGKLPNTTLPGSTQLLEWRHLLAWCIRDQKTRFDAFFHWRDGDGLGFRRSRQDPPLFVRSVLGLHDNNVDKLMREIDELEDSLEQVVTEIPELERLPVLQATIAERQLRSRLGAPEGCFIFKDLLGESLEGLVEQKVEALEKKYRNAEPAIERTESTLGQLLAELSELEQRAKIRDLEVGIAQSVLDGNEKTFNTLSKELADLEQLAGHCRHGDVDFAGCTHIIQRRTTHSFSWLLSKQAAQADVEKQKGEVQRLQTLATRACKAVEDQALVVADQRKSIRKLNMSFASIPNDIQSLREQWDGFVTQRKQLEEGTVSEALADAREKKDELEKTLEAKRSDLFLRRKETSVRSESLKALTKQVANKMLGADGFGVFNPESDLRPFELGVGGEAYQVLEVLLGDITTLLDSAVSELSLHPGLIVHDCPREADMSERLYRDYLSLVREAEGQLQQGNSVPFQYIVTTTSPPPASLCQAPYLVLELKPGDEQDSLFKKRLDNRLPGF